MNRNDRIRYRHEFKYLLDTRSYYRLKSILGAVMARDEHTDEDGGYSIRSLYFDDYRNTDFFAKLSGFDERKKYRIRFYNMDESYVCMEKKMKDVNGSYKRSTRISAQTARSVISGDFSRFAESKSSLLREVALAAATRHLRPSVITDYRREPFVVAAGNVRITFDTQLCTALTCTDLFDPNLPLFPVAGPGRTILEVKYDAFIPSFVSDALSRCGGINLAVSKYALCRKYVSMNGWEVI